MKVNEPRDGIIYRELRLNYLSLEVGREEDQDVVGKGVPLVYVHVSCDTKELCLTL
jgi:hypothetical protein